MKTKKNQKYLLIYIAIGLVVVIAGVFLIIGNPFKYFDDKVISSNSYQDEESYGDVSSIFQDQIESYLSSYLQSADNLGYVTEDDMSTVTAEITTGILNSIPETELTEKNWDEIRQFVTDAVTTEMTTYNLTNNETTIKQFELTDEFKNYINSQIVPAITAEYQIYNNDIDDLRKSLSNLSNEYAKNKASYDSLINNIKSSMNTIATDIKRVSDVASSTDEIDKLKETAKNINGQVDSLKQDTQNQLNSTKDELQAKIDAEKANLTTNITNLTTVLNNYKSETAQNFTTVDGEISALEAKINEAIASITQITQQQVNDVKTSLKAQIDSNSSLLDSQKQEYTAMVDNLQASTTTELASAVSNMESSIKSKTEENANSLKNAIGNLYGGADSNITISELLTQIADSNDYTDEQKTQLTELINTKYGSLESSTQKNIDTVKDDLTREVEARKSYTDTAVDSLRTSVGEQLAEITQQLVDTKAEILQITKSQVDEVKTTLTAQIENNSSLLDEQKKDYIAKINAIDASTTKELQDAVNSINADILQKSQENSDALNSAIEKLYGGANDTITISGLVQQIQDSNDYTDEQKTQLTALINQKYGDLDTSTKKNISDIKSDLTQEVADRKQYTDDAVANLNTTLSGQIATLTKQQTTTASDLKNTKTDLSKTKTDLTNTKNDLSDTKNTVASQGNRLDLAETDIENINDTIDSMTSDEWIDKFTIPTSAWVSDGTGKYYYRVTNSAILMSPESDITVNYADTSIKIAKYEQSAGYFDIYVYSVPASSVVVNYVHIQNRATN